MNNLSTLSQNHNLSYTQELNGLCQQLFLNTSIDSFHYFKIYSDGRCISLNTDPKVENYLLFENKRSFLHDYKIFDIAFNSKRYKNEFNNNKICLFAEDIGNGYWNSMFKIFNIKTCFNIVEKSHNYYERFGFRSKLDNSYYSFYLNDYNLLEKFILYFKDRGTNLIRTMEQKSFIWVNNNPSYNNLLQTFKTKLDHEHNYISNLKTSLKLKRYPIIHNNTQIYLTPCELTCLQYISQGFSYKEIANLLHISNRTIEVHMRNIKSKLSVNSNRKLLDIYHSSILKNLIKA